MRRIIATRLNTPLMLISEGRQAIVTAPAIGRYYRSCTHDILDEANQCRSCDIGDLPEPYAAKPFGRVNFNRYDNYGLGHSLTATNPLFCSTNVCFVNLNMSTEHVPAWSYHVETHLVQPGPGSLITPQPEYSFQPKSAYTEFLISQVPYGLEPNAQRLFCALEHCVPAVTEV